MAFLLWPFSRMSRLSSARLFGSLDTTKRQAMEALQEVDRFVRVIDSLPSWQTEVMLVKEPVVLQCYAGWSRPCLKLIPIMERETMKGLGKWRFVKFDIDSLPSLASALEIKRVPTLFLINRGNVIHKFEGVPDETQMKAFMSDVQILSGLSTDEDVAKGLIEAAQELLTSQEWDKAVEAFSEALNHEKWREKYGTMCQLGLAQAYLGRGDLQRASETLQALKQSSPEVEQTSDFKAVADSISSAEAPMEYSTQLKAVQGVLAKSPSNLEALLRKAALCFKLKLYREAIDAALRAIEIEETLKGDGHEVLMEVLKALPPSDTLAQEGRRRLQKLFGKFN